MYSFEWALAVAFPYGLGLLGLVAPRTGQKWAFVGGDYSVRLTFELGGMRSAPLYAHTE